MITLGLALVAVAAGATTGEPPALAATVAASVSPERVIRDVERLAGFGTRHTLSDTTSESRGIGAARRWIRAEFERIAAASGREGALAPRVWFDTHLVEPDGRRISRPVEVVNVVCELPGAMVEARGRLYYVIGHYDSRASDPLDAESDAPGANDDASGVAVALEVARVIAPHRLDATVVLMATAGEEQGLYGARRHAEAARQAGRDIRAVLSNDIVGDPTGPPDASGLPRIDRHHVRVFSEGLPRDPEAIARVRAFAAEHDSPSRQLARFIAMVAREHRLPVQPMLVFRADRFLRGGDHTPFNELGFPAVRFTEVHETYSRQHQDVRVEDGVVYGDRVEYVDAAYLADVARLNAAAIVHLANAPSPPGRVRFVLEQLSNDTTLRWDASPEPDVAGYEIVWRATTSADWEAWRDVGLVTQATIDLSKDHWHFGVRAYDTEGYRSPVAFPFGRD